MSDKLKLQHIQSCKWKGNILKYVKEDVLESQLEQCDVCPWCGESLIKGEIK
jgi:hypothetical protein